MNSLLPPYLICKRNELDTKIWTSEVVPAYKIRPINRNSNDFAGCQLMVFAKKFRGHIVYDAQVNLGLFCVDGLFTCRPTCEKSFGCVCSGRMNLKDDFLSSPDRGSTLLDLNFFEDGICKVHPHLEFMYPEEFNIDVRVARGRDCVKGADRVDNYTIEFLFKASGRSLADWMKRVNHV